MGRILRALSVRIRSLWAAANARRASLRRLEQHRARRVLVVCYGNIYRSALTGALLKARCGEKVEVRSAGFHPVSGRRSPDRHVAQAKRLGVSLESHRSATITAEDIAWADLTVIMDRHNWADLRRLGSTEDRIVWLGSLIPGSVELKDPYALDDRAAERIVERLHRASERLASVLGAQT